jgi:hypothetical protein
MAKKTIGRFDRADFPELGLEGLKVKVDTGAYTSSLYATSIHVRRYKGVKHLYFKALGPEHPQYQGKPHRFALFSMKEVKSSSGETELRYFVETVISLFGEEYPIVISLTNRSKMRTPVLLGRRLIRNRFVVDVTRSNVSLKKSAVTKKKTRI